MSIASILAPIAVRAGLKILPRVLRRSETQAGGVAADVIDAVAGNLAIDPTPEAIAEEHRRNPVAVDSALAAAEADHLDALLAVLDQEKADARSDDPVRRRMRPITSAVGLAVLTAVVVTLVADPPRGREVVAGLADLPLMFWAAVLGPAALWFPLRTVEKWKGLTS